MNGTAETWWDKYYRLVMLGMMTAELLLLVVLVVLEALMLRKP